MTEGYPGLTADCHVYKQERLPAWLVLTHQAKWGAMGRGAGSGGAGLYRPLREGSMGSSSVQVPGVHRELVL